MTKKLLMIDSKIFLFLFLKITVRLDMNIFLNLNFQPVEKIKLSLKNLKFVIFYFLILW